MPPPLPNTTEDGAGNPLRPPIFPHACSSMPHLVEKSRESSPCDSKKSQRRSRTLPGARTENGVIFVSHKRLSQFVHHELLEIHYRTLTARKDPLIGPQNTQ